ncbi:hypothetical protein WIS42_P72 [Staphylococcus phage vB_SpsM_WIS42]|uniref:Uncharacterized protein n=1 Tax=Staphylococcus phage vB_SpsM_WIS42 TaxID=2596715 RepID=A0A5B8RM46_9CAUD|nr:hypothetical protein KMD14_gp72 [Staphylococcus phage vB_SpsM_WIS42]QEA10049.1 hypothetical protein WIS42_P72 [Staphylococcus phage vB_SpsM_WIS42]
MHYINSVQKCTTMILSVFVDSHTTLLILIER